MFTTQRLAIEGGELAYEIGGAGPLVVCAPGMGDVRAEYRFLAPRLVEAGFRVAVVDLRGHGESSVGFADYRPETVGRDLLALVGALGGPAVLIGCSFTGASIVWAAVEDPSAVSGLVLIDPFARDVPIGAFKRLLFRLLLARPWGRAAWRSYYRSLYPTAKPVDLDGYVARLGASLRERGRFEALKAMADAPKSACDARLEQVTVPSLVVMGTRDPDFPDPAAEARLVAERLRGEVLLVDGAGHYPHAEMPEKVAGPIAAFARAQVTRDAA